MPIDITVHTTRTETADDRIDTGDTAPDVRDLAKTTRIGVVLGGRYPLTLCGVSYILEKEHDHAVLAVCTDATSTLEAVERHRPDIVILDLDRSATFNVLRRIHHQVPSARIVVLTAAAEYADMIDAMRVGARAIVGKELPPDAFMTCIRKVYTSEPIDGPSGDGVFREPHRTGASARRMMRQLTPRETEIARLAVLGVPTREIANRLAVKQGTVKIHLHSIYDKLSVGGRLGLILFARRHGLA